MNKMNVNKLLKHLNDKWGNIACPMCGSSGWNVSDTIYELREFHGGNLVLGNGPIVPIVPVSCNNCGNTVLVNALLSGAIDKPNIESEKNNK
jgi:predicted nucleic-acid-binding Zn-ribbon protein